MKLAATKASAQLQLCYRPRTAPRPTVTWKVPSSGPSGLNAVEPLSHLVPQLTQKRQAAAPSP